MAKLKQGDKTIVYVLSNDTSRCVV